MAHHRHDQAVIGLGGDADIDALMAIYHASFIIVARIDLRKRRQARDQRAHQKRQHRKLWLIGAAGIVEVRAQLLKLGEIAFLDIRIVRDAPLGLLHLLGDLAPQADHLDRHDGVTLGEQRAAAAAADGREHRVQILVRHPPVRPRPAHG